MELKSWIEIDGFRIEGDAKMIFSLGSTIERALKHLKEKDRDSIWMPFTGTVNDGLPMLQRVRLHRGSSIHTTVIQDSSIEHEVFANVTQTFNEGSRLIFEKFAANDDDTEDADK